MMRFIAAMLLALALAMPCVATAQQGGMSLDEAVQRVKRQGDVRVLSAERVNRNGKPMYRIKVLTGGGRVKYVWVDPSR